MGFGPVAELPDLLQRPVHAGAARDLLHEIVALAEHVAADLDDLIGVRGMGQVVDGKDQDLGEMPRFFFVFVGVSGDLLDDLPVAVRRGDVLFDLLRRKFTLVLELIEHLLTRLRVDEADLLALLQEDAVHPHVGLDLDRVVIDQEAILDRLLGRVAIGHLVEERKGVGGRCCREADLDGIEVIQDGPPDSRVLRRIAPVALVGNNGIEGVDRDVESVGSSSS